MGAVVIVGGGPAGVSAALYAKRAGAQTTLLVRDGGTLARVKDIENYYGFEAPVSGEALFHRGLSQAERLGVRIVRTEALSLDFFEKLTVTTGAGQFPGDAVILATGASRTIPKIEGIARLEGAGVSYCAVCDGFFFRGKEVAVLGAGAYALHEAQALLPICGRVTLLTGGQAVEGALPEGLTVDPRPLAGLLGDQKLEGLRFENGETQSVSGLFVALGVAGSADLARKVGAEIEGNRIVVDAQMATAVPGLFAAGDCTGGIRQIAQAVYQGATAGMAAAKLVKGA